MNNKKKEIPALVLYSFLLLLMCGALIAFCCWGINREVRLSYIAAGVFIGAAAIIVVISLLSRRFDWMFSSEHITKMAEEMNAEGHFKRVEELKKSGDMFEACDSLSKGYHKGKIVISVILAVCLNVLLVIGLVDNKVTSLPIIICAILVVEIISALIVVAAVLVEPSFIPGNKLKAEIIKQGFDADDVNNDFMHSTINYLAMGIMAVGETYCIVHTPQEFRIAKLEDITKADQYSIYFHMYRNHNTNYYIRIHEKDNTYRDYKFIDKFNADLMLARFLAKDIKTETFPTGTRPPEAEMGEREGLR